MTLHHDRRRAGSFGDDAEQYDRARPSYPSPLIDDLLTPRGRSSPAVLDALDVGCGTGKAARLLRDRGARVLGIEPDERMADVARRRHGLEVESGTFEAWDAAGRRFDLVVSGQAWHWVDPEAGAAKAAGVLRPGGRLAVFWNAAHHRRDVKAAFEAVYSRIAPGLAEHSMLLGNVGAGRFADAAVSFRRNGAFEDPKIRTYRWDVTYTRDQWLDHLPTHSDHRTLPPGQLARLAAGIGAVIDERGGSFDLTYETTVVESTRRGSP